MDVLESLSRVRIELPCDTPAAAELGKVLRRSMARDPAARFPTVRSLQQALIPALHACPGIVVTAAYVLRVVQRVFFGEFDANKYHGVGDVTALDKAAMAILSFWLILVGVYPPVMAPMVASGMEPIARLLGGA